MPLDPLAKRFLAMMAAASPGDRSRPTADDRRQALAKLMQFARADVPALVGVDGIVAGPGGGYSLPSVCTFKRCLRAVAGLRLLPRRRHGRRQYRNP